MVFVAVQFDVGPFGCQEALEAPTFQALVEGELRTQERFPRQLNSGLFQVVVIKMKIPKRVYKFTRCEITHVCYETCKQGVAGDVEWNTEEGVGTALVELAVQEVLSLNLEVKQCMAWRQIHFVAALWIPPGDDKPSGVRICLNLVKESGDLVDAVPVRIIPAKRPPKIAVYRSEIAWFSPKSTGVGFIRPFLPDVYTSVPEVLFATAAGEKPEQLLGDPPERESLGGE